MNPSRPVILSLSAGLILAALAAGCGSSSPDPAEPPRAPTPGSFDHQQHDTLRCEECHALSSVLSGAPARPGASDHSPCDRAKCHRAEFMRAPGALCRLCHESVDVTSEDGTTLVVYPPSTGPRALPSLFSHKSHLDRGAMERAVGFHVSCTDCHSAADSSALRQPDHSTCARCHAPESGVGDAPRLTDCTRCHFPLVAPPPATER